VIAIAERKVLRLTVMTALYVAQGIPYGFVTVTLAAYLAKHGASEGDIGDLTAFAMLPWSFKWLWAPLVDRFSHSQMGRRRPWIIVAQLVLVTMSSALIFVPDVSAELDTVRWMVFAANVFASLQDVSVDALAVDLLPESERGFANGLMYGGSYLGVIFGGAVLSTIAGREGLSAAMITQGLTLGAIMLLPLLLRERATDKWFSLASRPPPSDKPRANLFKLLARAFGRRSPLIAAALAIGVLLASQTLSAVMTVLLMKKLGWQQEEFGQMQGGLPLLFGLSGSIVGGWLADKIGHKKMVAIASIALGGVFLTFALGEAYWEDRTFIVFYSCAREVCYGTLSASLFALLMGVSWPAVAATQFTAYMALLNLGRTLGSKLAGPLTDELGTRGTFLTLGIWQLVVIALLLPIDPSQNRRELGDEA
jgi:PAT family beta-lactamase induction signal transducer AmpG